MYGFIRRDFDSRIQQKQQRNEVPPEPYLMTAQTIMIFNYKQNAIKHINVII